MYHNQALFIAYYVFNFINLSTQTFEESTAAKIPEFFDIEILEPAMMSRNAASVIACHALCLETTSCESYSYNWISELCQLYTTCFIVPASVAHQVVSGWNYYKIIPDQPQTVAACQNGGCLTFSSSQYLIITTNKIWDDAQTECQSLGGKLAEAETVDENTFIKTELQAAGGDRYFIGGYNYNVDATFEWASDPYTPISYSDWEPGQPNSISSCYCLYSNSAYQYRWGDISCTSSYPYICEFP